MSRWERLVLWAIAAVTVAISVALGLARSAEPAKIEHPHWIIEAMAIDASTGAQIGDSKALHFSFGTPEDCLKVLADIGPIPAHAGRVIVLRCHKVGPPEQEG